MSFAGPVILMGALTGGIVSGIAGFGGGPIVLVFWLLVLAPQTAAPLLTVSFVWSALYNVWTVRHAVSWRQLLPFVAGGLIGVPAGALMLEVVSPRGFRQIVGGFLVGYAILRLSFLKRLVVRARSGVPDTLAGIGSGLIAGLAGTPGPPISLWCGLRGFAKDEQRAVVSPFNLMCTCAAITAYARAGLMTAEIGWLTLWSVPGVILGNLLGQPIYRRLSDSQFSQLLLWLLLVMGVLLLI